MSARLGSKRAADAREQAFVNSKPAQSTAAHASHGRMERIDLDDGWSCGPTMQRGTELWRKKLSRTDAQRQDGHHTGDLRLVQAAKPPNACKCAPDCPCRINLCSGPPTPDDYNSSAIDQTTHFRHSVFSHLAWRVVKTTPHSEVAETDFDVTILGTHYGNRRLELSHKPDGEADQDNYTTNIRWGTLAAVIQQVDIHHRMFYLYSPPAGASVPFFIVIE